MSFLIFRSSHAEIRPWLRWHAQACHALVKLEGLAAAWGVLTKERLLVDANGQCGDQDVTRQFVSPLGGCARSGQPTVLGNYPPGRRGDGGYCTTRRENAHSTEVSEVHYPFHPLSACIVHLHGVFTGYQKTGRRCPYGSRDSDAHSSGTNSGCSSLLPRSRI
jgi:hypothetical protein